jgi:hypothetical protein
VVLTNGCSKPNPHVSQFNNCPKELVKPQSYCALKRYWNKGTYAIANLFEITFHSDCTAEYSFHNVMKDGTVSQVTCGKAEWGLDHDNLIIDPDGVGWVGTQEIGAISIESSKFYPSSEPSVIFESPCPFETVNRLCR